MIKRNIGDKVFATDMYGNGHNVEITKIIIEKGKQDRYFYLDCYHGDNSGDLHWEEYKDTYELDFQQALHECIFNKKKVTAEKWSREDYLQADESGNVILFFRKNDEEYDSMKVPVHQGTLLAKYRIYD